MTDYSEAAQEMVQAHIDQHGFLSWLDMTVEDLEPGELEMRVPYDPKLANHSPGGEGNVHGGIASTLIDTAGGIACRTVLDDPTGGGVATINLDVSYLRPAKGDLVAEAEVVRTGSTVGVATVSVESQTPDGEWKEVAVGKGSYRLFTGD